MWLQALGLGLAAVFLLGIGATVVAWQRRRVRRVVSRSGDAWFVGAVAPSPSTDGARVLLVDDHGISLLRLSGALSVQWPWSRITSVQVGRIPYRYVVSWPGIVIALESRWQPELTLIVDPIVDRGAAVERALDAGSAVAFGISARAAAGGEDKGGGGHPVRPPAAG